MGIPLPYGVAVGFEVAKSGLRPKPDSHSLTRPRFLHFLGSFREHEGRGVCLFPLGSPKFYLLFFNSLCVSIEWKNKKREREKEKEREREREREEVLVRLRERKPPAYERENRDRKRGKLGGVVIGLISKTTREREHPLERAFRERKKGKVYIVRLSKTIYILRKELKREQKRGTAWQSERKPAKNEKILAIVYDGVGKSSVLSNT